MQYFEQLPRAVYNLTVLRGRRRVTRLIILVTLSVFAYAILRHGACSINPESCYGDKATPGYHYNRDREQRDQDMNYVSEH